MDQQPVSSNDVSDPITSVEEFIPDEGQIDRSFLDDPGPMVNNAIQTVEGDSDRYLIFTIFPNRNYYIPSISNIHLLC